jgi:hypothetical protein
MKNIVLRLSTGLFLVAGVCAAGMLPRSPWIILPLALTFTIAHILGRFWLWRSVVAAQPLSRTLGQIAITFATQIVVVAVLYLIGRGIGAVMGRASVGAFSDWDIVYCIVFSAIGLALSGIVIWRERNEPPAAALMAAKIAAQLSGHQNGTSIDDMTEEAYTPSDEIRLVPGAVTLDNFYSGFYYTHIRREGDENTDGGAPGTPLPGAIGSDEKIAAAEAYLGVVFPDGLRALYRKQNGGSVNGLCVPKPGVEKPRLYDEVINPFGGYDDLLPCESLKTMFELVCHYADPEEADEADAFPEGSKNMIVLAQWYRHTLFLDYSTGDPPSVGFVDFDHDDWKAHCVRWQSFEAFFAALRHYEEA